MWAHLRVGRGPLQQADPQRAQLEPGEASCAGSPRGEQQGRRMGQEKGGEGERREGKSLRADAAGQIKLLPVVNFIHEVVDQNVI